MTLLWTSECDAGRPLPEAARHFLCFSQRQLVRQESKAIADYLLDKGGVACLAGTAFGREGEGYLRLSFGTSMEKIREGLSASGMPWPVCPSRREA